MVKKLLFSLSFLCIMSASNCQWLNLGNNSFFAEAIAVDDTGNVYAGGYFTDSSGNEYVAKWNGEKWIELGTGNNALNANEMIKVITIDGKGNIYAAGHFSDSSGKNYVAQWNGTKWSQLGADSNECSSYNAINSILVDDSGNVYTNVGNILGTVFNVEKWNKTGWSYVGDSNSLNANSFIGPVVLDKYGNIYTAGNFMDNNGKQYVAKWDGVRWSELGGMGINALNANSLIITLVLDDTGNVYVAGNFTNADGYFYVAKWNGQTWAELGNGTTALNANSWINSMAFDKSGNLYVVGHYTNNNQYSYVAKWDGIGWSALDTTNEFIEIYTIAIDNSNNIYVSGLTEEMNCVARYSLANVTNIANSTTTNSTINAYPNPTNGSITINTPESGQISIYNTLGEAIVTQNLQVGNANISLDRVPTGIYTIIFTGQNNSYIPIKVVKE